MKCEPGIQATDYSNVLVFDFETMAVRAVENSGSPQFLKTWDVGKFVGNTGCY